MKNPPLRGKVIVLIGGTTGMGLSASKALVQAGANIVAVGKALDGVEEIESSLGHGTIAFAADASRPQTAPKAIALALEEFGRLDGLFHVAGGSGRQMGDGPLHSLTDQGWQFTLDLNLKSLFYSNRAAVQHFLAHGGGSILNMSSVLAFSPSPHYFATHAYSTSKAAIIGLTKACAAYYAPNNIRFNALAPALIETPMSKRATSQPEIMRYIQTKQPLDGGRPGQPADIDAAAIFFLSDASRFVTGQVLAIDGGWCLSDGQLETAQSQTPKPTRPHRTPARRGRLKSKD